MKPQYKYSDSRYIYYNHVACYYRNPKTFNEIRQNYHAEMDGIKVRGSRKNIPTSWDDIWPSQVYGRDWKRFTKKRKQWMK